MKVLVTKNCQFTLGTFGVAQSNRYFLIKSIFVIILEYWMKLNIKRFLCLALFNIQLWYSLFSYKYTIHLKLNIKIEYWKNFDVLFCSLFTSYLIWHNWNCLKSFPYKQTYNLSSSMQTNKSFRKPVWYILLLHTFLVVKSTFEPGPNTEPPP